jgi:hypothetical protein
MLKDSYKLLRITDPKEVFPLLAHKEATWDDIFEGFDLINDRNSSLGGTIPRNFYMPDSFKQLEVMGLDYNHKDEYGNQFFHYIMDKLENQTVKVGSRMYGEAILPYLLAKTENIYELNWGGRHILFNMMTYSTAGVQGEKFKEMLQQYPNFDLHIVDKGGKNLFHYALLKNSPPQLIDFLLEKKVDTHLVNKDSYNALNYFSLAGFNHYQKNLFSTLIRELDISHETVHKGTCISDWIEFVSSDSVNRDNKKNPAFWLNFACKKIVEKDFLYTNDTLSYLLKTLESNKVKYFSELYVVGDNDTVKELKTNYTHAITAVKTMKLELLLPEKSLQDKHKVKI